MKPSDQKLADQFDERLGTFAEDMPGFALQETKSTFIRQLVDSTHRTKYIDLMKQRGISPLRADPRNLIFDPVLAAIYLYAQGDLEEACWLVFLSVHFGKHRTTGWTLTRRIYGRLDSGQISSWERTSQDFDEFAKWLESRKEQVKKGPPPAGFGNHRKYESLSESNGRGTPASVRTYIEWVQKFGSHQEMFLAAAKSNEGNPAKAFDFLYNDMAVASFGRLAKFDYLSMIGKIGIASIKAGSTYVQGATGPLKGAEIVFGKGPGPAGLDKKLASLAFHLDVTMQDMEDAVCNWQKNPKKYERFKG